MIMIADAIRAAAEVTGIPAEEITGPSKSYPVARARHIAVAVAHELSDKSMQQIARAFGRGDHSVVINSIKRSKKLDRSTIEQVQLKALIAASERLSTCFEQNEQKNSELTATN